MDLFFEVSTHTAGGLLVPSNWQCWHSVVSLIVSAHEGSVLDMSGMRPLITRLWARGTRSSGEEVFAGVLPGTYTTVSSVITQLTSSQALA